MTSALRVIHALFSRPWKSTAISYCDADSALRKRAPFSLVLITRNAGTQLRASLESARFADEIVVVDSGSEDDTVDIAASFGARVVAQSWLGFGAQKRFAVEHAQHDWVLCLDA